MENEEKIVLELTPDELELIFANLYGDSEQVKNAFDGDGVARYEKVFDGLSKKIAKEEYKLIAEFIEQNENFNYNSKLDNFEKDLKYRELDLETICEISKFIYLDLFRKDYIELQKVFNILFNFLIDKVR